MHNKSSYFKNVPQLTYIIFIFIIVIDKFSKQCYIIIKVIPCLES